MEGYLKTLLHDAGRLCDQAESICRVHRSSSTRATNSTSRRAAIPRPSCAHLIADPRVLAVCFRLRDRFGDNGLISVILARPEEQCARNALLIDTWLMSCRVLGRQVEAAALEVIAKEAAHRGSHALIGEYRPTARNALVAEHYPKLGFEPLTALDTGSPGSTFWRFDVENAPPPHFITVERLS